MALETMTEALTRLESAGYTDDFRATDEGLLRCGACAASVAHAIHRVDEGKATVAGQLVDRKAFLIQATRRTSG